MKKTATLLFTLALSLGSYAANDPYYEIDQVVVEDVSNLPFEFSQPANDIDCFDNSKASIGEVIAVVDQIIALGEKIYKIVEKGQAVVNTSYEPINILPLENDQVADAIDLENWSMPKSRKYRIRYVNKLGMDTVDFIYSVNMVYGGSYQGKGKYITGLQIVPEYLNVIWGYNFDVSFQLVTVVNHATKEDPNVGAKLLLNYQLTNLISNIQSHETFHVTGNGSIDKI